MSGGPYFVQSGAPYLNLPAGHYSASFVISEGIGCTLECLYGPSGTVAVSYDVVENGTSYKVVAAPGSTTVDFYVPEQACDSTYQLRIYVTASVDQYTYWYVSIGPTTLTRTGP